MKNTEIVTDIRKRLVYNPETGVITWKSGTPGVKAGTLAGGIKITANGYTYRRIRISGKEYTASRVAWILQTGEIPDFIIDHIDNNPLNTKWENLRDGSNCVSQRNARFGARSTTGHCGVYQKDDRFEAWIGRGNGIEYIGSRDTLEEAVALRQKAEVELGYSETHGRAVRIPHLNIH